MTRFASVFRTAAFAAISLACASTTLAGDLDDGSWRTHLELRPVAVGGTSGIDLRTQTPHSPFALLLDTSIHAVDADGPGAVPWLRVLGPQTLVLFGATDGAGRFAAGGSVPNDPALTGALVFAQALVLTTGGMEATNVAATTFTPGLLSWSFGDISQLVPTEAQQYESGSAAARDLDSDGDPDLVLITGPAATLHVYRNDGQFNFTDVTATALPLAAVSAEAEDVQILDVDNDRRQDLLVIGGVGNASTPPLPNMLLRNLGNLKFQEIPLPDVPGLAREVAVADLDRDGDLDLVFANGSDGVHSSEVASSNALLVNQGGIQGGVQGTFAIDAAFAAAPWNSVSFNVAVAAGDIDDDGDVDLFFGRADTQSLDGTPGQPNVLLRNDGNLAFTDVSATHLVPLFSDNTEGARFGDLDGDGRLDLMVANSGASVLAASSGEYYRNTGNGVFVEDAVAFPQIDDSELSVRLGVRLVDVDLDGDLDAIFFLHEFFDFDMSTGASTGGDDMLFVNQGGGQGGVQGTFTYEPGFTAGGIFVTADHVYADFDLDGDDDLYVCNRGTFFGTGPVADHLFMNLRVP